MTTESVRENRIINTAIKTRVVKELCIDCGVMLGESVGYCYKRKCGYDSNPIKLTPEEIAEATIDFDRVYA